MRINIKVGPSDEDRGPAGRNPSQPRPTARKEKIYLTPDALLKYFITDDEPINSLIVFKNTEYNLVTSDANLYQALGSIKEYDAFRINKLVKLLEVVDVFSTRQAGRQKLILKDERVEELRKLALKTAEK